MNSEGRTFDSFQTCHFHLVFSFLARVITELYRSATRKLA